MTRGERDLNCWGNFDWRLAESLFKPHGLYVVEERLTLGISVLSSIFNIVLAILLGELEVVRLVMEQKRLLDVGYRP
jgi:hypothetical protein